MRKSILRAIASVVGVFALVTGSAFADVVIKGGIDLGGKHEVENLGPDDVETGYSIAAEFTKPVLKFLHLGAGAEYQFPRSVEGDTGQFNFLPLYAVARVTIPLNLFTPYATARVGYNFLFGDDDYKGIGGSLKGGLHYGFGAGAIVFKFLLVEGIYAIYNGTGEFGGGDWDINYSTFGIKAGVKF
jgi:hypothetical protein